MASPSSSGRRREKGAESVVAYESVPPRPIGGDSGGGRRRRRGSPKLSAVSVLIERGAVTEGAEVENPNSKNISSSINNPRSFPYTVKQQCWEKAEKVRGRDPERWRLDPLGNLVFRKLVGCPGCLCYDFDHILPFSKGGKSTLENCQILQEASVNRAKGDRTEICKADLIQKSAYCRVSGRDMDIIELSAYGNVHRGQDSGGCRIQ